MLQSIHASLVQFSLPCSFSLNKIPNPKRHPFLPQMLPQPLSFFSISFFHNIPTSVDSLSHLWPSMDRYISPLWNQNLLSIICPVISAATDHFFSLFKYYFEFFENINSHTLCKHIPNPIRMEQLTFKMIFINVLWFLFLKIQPWGIWGYQSL